MGGMQTDVTTDGLFLIYLVRSRRSSGGKWWAFLRGRQLTVDAEKIFSDVSCQLSRCFSLHSQRTCIISSQAEIDCTPPGAVDVAMFGPGLSSWEHGIWCVRWFSITVYTPALACVVRLLSLHNEGVTLTLQFI